MLVQFLITAPFYRKSTLSVISHFLCFTRPGTTDLRQSLNLNVKYYADPFV